MCNFQTLFQNKYFRDLTDYSLLLWKFEKLMIQKRLYRIPLMLYNTIINEVYGIVALKNIAKFTRKHL